MSKRSCLVRKLDAYSVQKARDEAPKIYGAYLAKKQEQRIRREATRKEKPTSSL